MKKKDAPYPHAGELRTMLDLAYPRPAPGASLEEQMQLTRFGRDFVKTTETPKGAEQMIDEEYQKALRARKARRGEHDAAGPRLYHPDLACAGIGLHDIEFAALDRGFVGLIVDVCPRRVPGR